MWQNHQNSWAWARVKAKQSTLQTSLAWNKGAQYQWSEPATHRAACHRLYFPRVIHDGKICQKSQDWSGSHELISGTVAVHPVVPKKFLDMLNTVHRQASCKELQKQVHRHANLELVKVLRSRLENYWNLGAEIVNMWNIPKYALIGNVAFHSSFWARKCTNFVF